MPSPTSLASPLPSREPPSSSGKWFPYRNAGDFDANLAMILIILFSALLVVLALNGTIRCFLRRSRNRSAVDDKMTQPLPALPALVFSAGMKFAGEESECAICLSEFVNGEGVRVLPRCNHGFHVKCIEGWLASRTSCPTCRANCLTPSPEKNLAPTEP